MQEVGSDGLGSARPFRNLGKPPEGVVLEVHKVAASADGEQFCRFENWPRVATRFDCNIRTFMSSIAIAAIVTSWL
ncbi:MAG: hypothetical protein ABJL57_09355 [Hyphomonas sp.]|uniref:hypothetical protein n=1 Tax=Hyphomonas sp. TaxID=87 RepID=UPI00329A468C